MQLFTRGEVSVLAMQHRRNQDKDVLVQHVERVHQADILCLYQKNDIFCALAAGGPHNSDLTKIASDNFHFPRMLKDILDDFQLKSTIKNKNGSNLYVIGIKV